MEAPLEILIAMFNARVTLAIMVFAMVANESPRKRQIRKDLVP
jgi:hypothetical protein